MRIYRCHYQHRDTREELDVDKSGNRPCDAKDAARNDLNARGLDAIQWPLVAIYIVGETS